jgi:hypothetical protein
MRGFELHGLSFDLIPQTPPRKHGGLFAQALHFVRKAGFQGLSLFETTTLLHALLESVRGGSARDGVQSPMMGPDSRAMANRNQQNGQGLYGARLGAFYF